MSPLWLVLATASTLARPPDDPRDPTDDPKETDIPREPDPPDPEPPAPEPEPEPEPEPQPEPEPEPEPEAPAPQKPRRTTGAPNVDLGVADGSAQLDLGADLIFKPRCNDKGGCNGGRLGLLFKLPVTSRSPTGGQRAQADALNGFSSSWRVGILAEYLRDATKQTGPAVFYLLTAGFDFGIQSFRHFPGGGDASERNTKASIAGLLRFLAYVHQPRKSRVVPQFLVTYSRNWAGAPAVGVAPPSTDPDAPIFTMDKVIAPPAARPAVTATLPVLFSVQRGKYVLPQLGFGPAIRYAAAGSVDGYNAFDGGHTVRGEFWLYWYPIGTEGLELQKTNARIGVSPFVDAFVAGRGPNQPTLNYGALVEIKVGARGYEY